MEKIPEQSTGKCHNDKVACNFVIGYLDMLILPLDHRKATLNSYARYSWHVCEVNKTISKRISGQKGAKCKRQAVGKQTVQIQRPSIHSPYRKRELCSKIVSLTQAISIFLDKPPYWWEKHIMGQ